MINFGWVTRAIQPIYSKGISRRRIIASGPVASVIYNALLFHFYTCLAVSPFPIARIMLYRSESPCNPAIGLSRGTMDEIESSRVSTNTRLAR